MARMHFSDRVDQGRTVIQELTSLSNSLTVYAVILFGDPLYNPVSRGGTGLGRDVCFFLEGSRSTLFEKCMATLGLSTNKITYIDGSTVGQGCLLFHWEKT